MNSTVIYIGAGDGQEVEAILDKVPDRLILIEPNPKLASKLRLKFENLEGVEVYELAVTATNSEKRKELTEYNWNKTSSIAETRELSLAYPGLKKINSYPVECIGIEELVAKLNLNNSDANSLIIEAPGVEGEIIDLLCQSGKVSLFEQLEITCPQSSFYVSNKNEGDIVTHLEKLGFELKFRNSDDTDWQKLVLEKNKWLDELIASRKQISEQKNHIDQLKSDKEGQSKLASERQAQLEQANKTKDEQAKLAADRAVELEQVTRQKQEQSNLTSDRQVQLEQLTTEKEEQVKLASDLQAQLEQANKTKDEQVNLAAERAVQLEQLGNEKEAQAKWTSDLQAQLEQANRTKDEQVNLASERAVQLEHLTNEKEDQSKLVSDLQAQLEQANKTKDEQSKLAAERTVELEQLTNEKEELSKLASERHAQLEELSAEKELLTARVSELEALSVEELKALQLRLDQSEESREVLSARVSELENLRQQEAESFESRLVDSSGSSEELREKLSNLEKEYFEARRSGDLSQKMITKSQLDLDDLRNKYANKVASENELIELVQELRQKLQLASQYYFELQKEHPELISAPEGF